MKALQFICTLIAFIGCCIVACNIIISDLAQIVKVISIILSLIAAIVVRDSYKELRDKK